MQQKGISYRISIYYLMERKFRMIKKVSNKLKQVLYLIKYFGFRQGLFEFLSAIFGTESILGKKFNFYKHENAKKYIRTRYGNFGGRV